jgi:hypothetical protein
MMVLELQDQVERITASMHSRLDDIRRGLRSDQSEFDVQVLEKVADLEKEIATLKARVTKIEDDSVWNRLMTEANKHGMTPEQYLREAIGAFLRKEREK